MKILVLGTGVIGSLYGCALSEKHEVVHYVRKDKLNIYDKKRIGYDILDERLSKKEMNQFGEYTYHCVSKVDDSYDLIIVPVKSFQLLEALENIIKEAPDAKFLLMTLDWNSQYLIDTILNKDQYIFGYPGGGGTFREGKLWANLGNDIMLGSIYKEQDFLLEKAKFIFVSCRFIPDIQENPLHWLWIHNVGSAPMGLALTKYQEMDSLLMDKSLLKMSFKAMRECYEICRKRGVELKKFDEVKMISFPLWLLYPMFKLNMKKNPAMKRYTAHATDSIGEMVMNAEQIYETGLELGIEMPNMTELIGIAKETGYLI